MCGQRGTLVSRRLRLKSYLRTRCDKMCNLQLGGLFEEKLVDARKIICVYVFCFPTAHNQLTRP